MVQKVILNADDLGFSPGVNQAVLKAHRDGFLTHASLMANTDFFDEAVNEIVPQCKSLNIGVHANLTCAQALYQENVLAQDGVLRTNFVSLLFKPKNKKVLTSIENELEAQILKIKSHGIKISHIDGHEHIHIIPSINRIVRKLALKHGIPRIREINEDMKPSFKYNFRTASFANVIKLVLLKFLSGFNKNKNEIQFYSMLNTCEINSENLFAYLEKTDYKTVEVMVHPGVTELDQNVKNLEPRFTDFLRSKFRTQELELCFNKKFAKYV